MKQSDDGNDSESFDVAMNLLCMKNLNSMLISQKKIPSHQQNTASKQYSRGKLHDHAKVGSIGVGFILSTSSEA